MITTVIADGKKEYEFIELLKNRAENSDKDVVPVVSEIIENVRTNGDRAVYDYTVKFDGKAPEKAEITAEEIDAIIAECDTKYIETVRKAAKKFGISKSTVHTDVTKRLKYIDFDLYENVRIILDKNKAQRHIRGGIATKEKYHRISHGG